MDSAEALVVALESDYVNNPSEPDTVTDRGTLHFQLFWYSSVK